MQPSLVRKVRNNAANESVKKKVDFRDFSVTSYIFVKLFDISKICNFIGN